MKRIRMIGVAIQPHLVIDDGQNLINLTTEPVMVSSIDWNDVVGIVAAAIMKLEISMNEGE